MCALCAHSKATRGGCMRLCKRSSLTLRQSGSSAVRTPTTGRWTARRGAWRSARSRRSLPPPISRPSTCRGRSRTCAPSAWGDPISGSGSRRAWKRATITPAWTGRLRRERSIGPSAATETARMACIGSWLSPSARTRAACVPATPPTTSLCYVISRSPCYVRSATLASASRPSASRLAGTAATYPRSSPPHVDAIALPIACAAALDNRS